MSSDYLLWESRQKEDHSPPSNGEHQVLAPSMGRKYLEIFCLSLVSTSNLSLLSGPFLTAVLTKAVASSLGDSEGNGGDW